MLGGGLWRHALGVGLAMAAVVIITQAAARAAGWDWRTMVFTSLALMQLGNAVASRSHGSRRLGLTTNPWLAATVAGVAGAQLAVVYAPPLQRAFDTHALGPVELVVVVAVSTAGFWLAEGARLITRHLAE